MADYAPSEQSRNTVITTLLHVYIVLPTLLLDKVHVYSTVYMYLPGDHARKQLYSWDQGIWIHQLDPCAVAGPIICT